MWIHTVKKPLHLFRTVEVSEWVFTIINVPPFNPIEPPQVCDGMIDITIMCTTSNHAVLRLCNPENSTALDCATIYSAMDASCLMRSGVKAGLSHSI